MAGPRSVATPPAHLGRPRAPAGAGVPTPARAPDRGESALDRHRDPSLPRWPRERLADRPRLAPPELPSEYQHHWGNKTYYTPLRLDPLRPERAAELLRSLIGEDATLVPLDQHLIEKTEGNPFFLEESIRTLVDSQVLVGAPGAYCLAQPVQHLRVPATVQAVLASRIDVLAPEDKRLLQIATVIGTEVPFGACERSCRTI